MKLECPIDKIKDALITTERITGKNLTLPVLGSILWIAKGNILTLRATNLSIGIEIIIPAKIEKEGIIAIKGDIISSFFSALQSDSIVQFEVINDNLVVKTKNNKTLIKSIPSDDFPTIPQVEGEVITIPNKKFIEGIKSVYYSASNSEIKPEIGSVYIYPEDDTIVFVATDSFRLSEKKIKIKQQINFNGILIPFKNIIEIIRIFDGITDDIKITLQKNQISFSVPNIFVTSRVIDGVFPDYRQIIPKEAKTKTTILKQDFLSALKVTNIFSDKFNQVIISINPDEKIFKLESKNMDIGENNSFINGSFSGENVIANFNYKYIVDCFQSIPQDSIIIELNGENKPMVIKPVGDESFKYLVMPMNK